MSIQLSRASESKMVTWKHFSIVVAQHFTERVKQLTSFMTNIVYKVPNITKNPAYGQHSALLYMSDSRVPIDHESKFIQWVLIYTMSPSLYHEFKSIPRVLLYIMYTILYHKAKSIPWVFLYTMSLKSIPWVQVNTMNPSLYHTIRFRKKPIFTMEEILFQIRTNKISNQHESNFKSEQIKFQIRTNPISHLTKSHFTLEEIPFHNRTHPISEWNKFHFT